MSDKNRNMNDINDQKTAEQQAFSEEIRRRLAEPGSGKPTLDEFKVMVYKDREKRRKKRNALVACIVAAFIVGFFTFDDLVPEVGADKNPKETIQTEDGVIIEDGGWGSSTGEDDVWSTTQWENVEDAKEIISTIYIPEYVPEGYTFKKMEIENVVDKNFICKYVFNNGNVDLRIELFITGEGMSSLEIADAERKIMSNKGDVYIQEKNKKIATIETNDGIIMNIYYNFKDEEIINIINGLK